MTGSIYFVFICSCASTYGASYITLRKNEDFYTSLYHKFFVG